MVFRPRTRQLRRAVVVAALGALVVPATAGAATKKTPVITKVTPKTAYVGAKLTITGKNFKRGKAKNSVLFRADGGKTLFVKADVSTAKKLTVKLPKSLEKYMATKGGQPVATRFRVRVLAAKLGKSFTAPKTSPVIAPERVADTGDVSDGAGVPPVPDGDCDADGVLNGVDLDDDNDLLDDVLELRLKLDPCVGDTDGDGVEDGFEYQSAIDLNNDDYQPPNNVTAVPGQGAVPEPALQGRGRRLRRRRAHAERRVQAVEVHLRGQPQRDAHPDARCRTRTAPVLAVRARRRQRRARQPTTDGGRLHSRRTTSALGRRRRRRLRPTAIGVIDLLDRPMSSPDWPHRELSTSDRRRSTSTTWIATASDRTRPPATAATRRADATGTSTPTATSPTTSATRTPTASTTTTRSAAAR